MIERFSKNVDWEQGDKRDLRPASTFLPGNQVEVHPRNDFYASTGLGEVVSKIESPKQRGHVHVIIKTPEGNISVGGNTILEPRSRPEDKR